MTFANNLKNLRAMKCISQAKLADVFGFTQQAVGRWEQGQSTPDYNTLVKLSKFFNVSTDYLLGRSDSPTGSYSADIGSPSKEKNIRIPILGRVAAGTPIGAVEEVIGWEEISKKLAAGGACFALRVCGHSMEPRILEGDTVIVRQQPNVDSGDIAVVLIGNEEATLKRVKKQKDGIILVANNPAVYEPHFYSNREIKNSPVRILGKVVEIRFKP